MSDISQVTKQSVAVEAQRDHRTLLFGSLAFIGAGASIVFCYAQVLISLIAPLFGLGAFELNLHLSIFRPCTTHHGLRSQKSDSLDPSFGSTRY